MDEDHDFWEGFFTTGATDPEVTITLGATGSNVMVEDVDFDSEPPEFPGEKFDLECGDCGAKMVLRKSHKYNTPFYGCSRYPDCDGKHGARADGSPKGIPGNKATRVARIRAHTIFDQIWKERLVQRRSDAYGWLRKAMRLSHKEGHIARFTEAQCEELIRLCYQHFPSLQTRYSRLSFDDDDDLEP